MLGMLREARLLLGLEAAEGAIWLAEAKPAEGARLCEPVRAHCAAEGLGRAAAP